MPAITSRQVEKPGWQADLALGFRRINTRTILAKRERKGPLAVQRPFYPEGGVCHVYLLHPPGGVVGGDVLKVNADLGPQAEALLTTPGATKFYRSAGSLAYQIQKLWLSNAACLEWFPQENIFFPGARVRMQLDIRLAQHARIAMWEIQCFGRPSLKEVFDQGFIDASLAIWREGVPLLLERLRVNGETRTNAALLRGQPVMATFVISGANQAALDMARKKMPDNALSQFSATLLEDLLLVRYLGDSTDFARKVFVGVWSSLRPMVLGKPASHPRIWNT